MKYFFKFLMIMTRKGSFIPRVFFGSAGQEINVVLHMHMGYEWACMCVCVCVCICKEILHDHHADYLALSHLTLVPTISSTSD